MATGDLWMLEPGTGKYRRVQAASGGAGTGINSGDYEYTTPAKYKEPAFAQGIDYRFDTSTTAADPGAGDLRLNHGTPASVTAVYFDDTADAPAADMGALLGNLAADDRLLIRQKSSPSKYVILKATGAATDNTGWWTLGVTVDASGTIFDSGAVLSVQILPKGGAGGGISNVVEDTTPQLGGDLDVNGFDFDGEARFTGTWHQKRQVIASATTIDIASLGNEISVTGTTQIDTINGGEDGTVIYIKFAATGVVFGTAGNIANPGNETWVSHVGDVVALVWDTSKWWHVGTSPGVRSGEIVMTARSSAPPQSLACDGTAVSRTTYARLFAKIGTNFGVGDGSTTFNVPDMDARFPVGNDSSTYSLADSADTSTHVHAETPHAHNLAGGAATGAVGAPAGAPSMGGGGGSLTNPGDPLFGASDANAASNVASTSHLPPYLAVGFYIFI